MTAMVTVWLVKDGDEPTVGEGYSLSLAECVEKLGLRSDNYRSPLGAPPKFGTANPKHVTGPRYVVVEINLAAGNWKPGYYLLKTSVRDALKALRSSKT